MGAEMQTTEAGNGVQITRHCEACGCPLRPNGHNGKYRPTHRFCSYKCVRAYQLTPRPSPAPQKVDDGLPKITEEQFTRQVIAYAKLCGWRVAHFRAARLKDGSWRTPVQGDGKGWPDLFLIKYQRVLVVELKSDDGELTREQREWMIAFNKTPIPWRVWRPRDWKEVEEALK